MRKARTIGSRARFAAGTLALALLCSLAIHLGTMAVLQKLPTYHRAAAPSEVEVTFVEGNEPIVNPAAPEEESERERPEQPRVRRPEPTVTPEVVAATPPTPPIPTPPAAPPQPAVPPPTPTEDRRAVIQRSQDPSVAPDNARFLAEENNRVAEETTAELTNTQEDSPTLSASGGSEGPEEVGDAHEDEARDTADVAGREDRVATHDEIAEPPSESSATGATSESPASGSTEERRAESQRELAETATEETVITDPFGTFRFRTPRRAQSSSADSQSAHTHGADGPQGLGRFALNYGTFEATFGADELRAEREARMMQQRSHSRGRMRGQYWDQFRAALENYVPEIRTGNQTALNAAASPFARFLAEMHLRIHREFSDEYLAGLSMNPGDPLADESLNTTIEMAVTADGRLARVGIIATSGNTLFDLGAFSSLMRAQPFPSPPQIVRSGDGLAWLHWRFDRGPRQCGTWNARPFMLRNAPRDTAPQPAPEGVETSDSSLLMPDRRRWNVRHG